MFTTTILNNTLTKFGKFFHLCFHIDIERRKETLEVSDDGFEPGYMFIRQTSHRTGSTGLAVLTAEESKIAHQITDPEAVTRCLSKSEGQASSLNNTPHNV